MLLTLLIVTISSICNVALAGFILWRRWKNIDVPAFLFVASVAWLIFWTIANFLADSLLDVDQALTWTRLTFPASLLMLFFIVWFSYLFPRDLSPSKLLLYGYAVAVAFFSAASLTPHIVTDITIGEFGGVEDVTLGDLYIPTIVLYLAFISNTIRNFWRQRRHATGQAVQQINYVIAGWSFFLLTAVLTNLILPFLTGNAELSRFGPLFSVAMVGAVTYAIVKHQFLDIKLIVQRGAIYTAIFTLIVSVYLGVLSLLGVVVGENTNVAVIVSGLVTTIIGVFSVPKLDVYLRRKTDHLFFKDTYNYREAMNTLSDVLNKHLDKDDLTTAISKTLTDILRVEYVSFVAQSDHEAALKEPDSEDKLRIPIRAQGELLDIIAIGKRRSGEAFSKKDWQLLDTFAMQAAVAFKKASLYQQVTEYSEELEHKVEARTAELKQLQENQKRSMLTISHGLQTPLTIIKGELHFLQKELPGKTLAVFEQSMDDVSRYITNLLKLTRLEATANTVRTSSDRINLSDLVEEICEYFSATTDAAQASFTYQVTPDVHIAADSDDVREIVTNLLSNAQKYGDPNRHNAISLSLQKKEGHCILTVADTGIGISAEALPHVFEGYYREQENSEKKGTGLGLAIVQQLIQRYGGKIDVESVRGEQTIFTITFAL